MRLYIYAWRFIYFYRCRNLRSYSEGLVCGGLQVWRVIIEWKLGLEAGIGGLGALQGPGLEEVEAGGRRLGGGLQGAYFGTDRFYVDGLSVVIMIVLSVIRIVLSVIIVVLSIRYFF